MAIKSQFWRKELNGTVILVGIKEVLVGMGVGCASHRKQKLKPSRIITFWQCSAAPQNNEFAPKLPELKSLGGPHEALSQGLNDVNSVIVS